jgi:LPXTG-motif cell wall-anchored protein
VLQRAVQSVGKTSADPDIVALRKQLLPIMAEDSIDLVLEGHDLSFTRSEPVAEDYNYPVPPTYTTYYWNNTKNEPAAAPTDAVTETYNGVSTTFEINAQGDTIYPYGQGVNGTANQTTPPVGTPSNAGITGGPVYIEPGVANGNSAMYSYKYYDPSNVNNALTDDNGQYYSVGASATVFPAFTLPSTLRTGYTTGAKLNGPTYAVVSVKGDKLAVTTYAYNTAGAPTVIDSHGVAKPVDQTALINQINALPSIDTISVSDYAAVKAAYDAYNALDAVDQTAVTNSQTLLDDVNLLQQIDPSLFTSSNPQTGSTANSAPFIILGVFCIGLISIIVFRKKIFRHSHNA